MSKEIDIEYYHQLALQKQKEHRKFLGNLKKKAPKNLDKIALEIHQEVFEEIDCTACANCCKSLGPDFKEADITRIAKYFKMKLPAFEDEFLQVDEDGDKILVIRSLSQCHVHFSVVTISVPSMMSVPRLVENFHIPTVKRFIKSII